MKDLNADMAVNRSPDDRLAPVLRDNERGTTVIAIVAFRNSLDVHSCISALANSTEKDFLILVCENGGEQSYQALIEALKDVAEFDGDVGQAAHPRITNASSGRLRSAGQPIRIYCAIRNLGYAGGVNLALSQIRPAENWSALWILNPDTEPDPSSLSALIKRARAGGFDVLSSRLVSNTNGLVQAYGSRWRPLLARGLNIGWNETLDNVPDVEYVQRTMDYVSGAALFATREFIERNGLMDERYFLYCEEVDWCLRGKHARFGYAHDSIVYHTYGTTIGSHADHRKRSKLSVYLDHRNGLLLTRRFFPALYPIVVGTSFLFTLRYLLAGATDNFSTALQGWLAGLRGEEGLPKQHDDTFGLGASEE